MKIALFALFMMLSPNFGNAGDNVEHPKQWQYQPSLEVPPGPIPRDRCIRAVLSPAMKTELGYGFAEQDPPLPDDVVEWFQRLRREKLAVLEFCNPIGA